MIVRRNKENHPQEIGNDSVVSNPSTPTPTPTPLYHKNNNENEDDGHLFVLRSALCNFAQSPLGSIYSALVTIRHMVDFVQNGHLPLPADGLPQAIKMLVLLLHDLRMVLVYLLVRHAGGVVAVPQRIRRGIRVVVVAAEELLGWRPGRFAEPHGLGFAAGSCRERVGNGLRAPGWNAELAHESRRLPQASVASALENASKGGRDKRLIAGLLEAGALLVERGDAIPELVEGARDVTAERVVVGIEGFGALPFEQRQLDVVGEQEEL
ncbi:hypothetical protein CCMA1212_003305 [Trichoderma ghanense]|uniref:Uncharacterized protein n=1 Tax=Trichoderma ghanense TaxID=65468 RepID=A0ABY2H955_9HYPO